jgi:hypothetical protein
VGLWRLVSEDEDGKDKMEKMNRHFVIEVKNLLKQVEETFDE